MGQDSMSSPPIAWSACDGAKDEEEGDEQEDEQTSHVPPSSAREREPRGLEPLEYCAFPNGMQVKLSCLKKKDGCKVCWGFWALDRQPSAGSRGSEALLSPGLGLVGGASPRASKWCPRSEVALPC